MTKLPVDSGTEADAALVDVFDAGCARRLARRHRHARGLDRDGVGQLQLDARRTAIDGNLGTVWNAGGFTGSITITFTSPQTIDGVKIYANALPTTTETYTIFGIQDQQTTQLAQSTQNVDQGSHARHDRDRHRRV